MLCIIYKHVVSDISFQKDTFKGRIWIGMVSLYLLVPKHKKLAVPGFVKLEEKWSVHFAEAAVLAQASAASCLAIELLSCQALHGQPLILPTKHEAHLDVLL